MSAHVVDHNRQVRELLDYFWNNSEIWQGGRRVKCVDIKDELILFEYSQAAFYFRTQEPAFRLNLNQVTNAHQFSIALGLQAFNIGLHVRAGQVCPADYA